MSEDTQTPESDKETNVANLRKEKEALEAQVAELTPLKVAQTVRQAGFDPDTPTGKALIRLADADSDSDAVKNLATELGFEAEDPAPAPSQTKQEQAVQAGADKLSELQSVTSSDEPESLDDEIAETDAALRAARAARNWDEARAIGEKLSRLNSQKIFSQVMTG